MSKITAVKPLESPGDTNPLTRLVEALLREGFTTDDQSDWIEGQERIYRRRERILFTSGETAFVLIDFPEFSEKVLKQAVEGIKNIFTAKGAVAKAMTVFQTTTVYVCIVAQAETPHNERLGRYISRVGGAIVIPVIIIPDINQVVYPASDEKLGIVRPRIEFLQYLLGERKEAGRMHKQTIQTFWVSLAIVGVLLLGVVVSMFTG
ncbi:MAG TPA: hypothetical protein VNM92_09680 [Thermoanaerobaculia bacterium]|nr:hypothetical protein [Thermoanaerobaculia bacterium]